MSNNTSIEMSAFCFGLVLGVIFTAIVLRNTGHLADFHDLRDECEKELQRDRNCIMRFVKPENLFKSQRV